jgi:hypothetical protein
MASRRSAAGGGHDINKNALDTVLPLWPPSITLQFGIARLRLRSPAAAALRAAAAPGCSVRR